MAEICAKRHAETKSYKCRQLRRLPPHESPEMNNLLLAIDPGLTGAFALLDSRGAIIAVEDLPVIRDGKLGWIDADTLVGRLIELRAGREMQAIIERVHAMPKNGCIAAFSQGCTFGSILASLRMVRARIEFVPPQTWKRSMGLIGGDRKLTDIERKRASLDKARLLFPDAPLDRQKDHGRAEALLIGYWHMAKAQMRAAA